MVSDRAKLWLLAAALFGCTLTFFTSPPAPSTVTAAAGKGLVWGGAPLSTPHGGNLPILQPPLHLYCKQARMQVTKCLDNDGKQQAEEHDSECGLVLQQASKCQQAVRQAFRHINLAGCSREIHALDACQQEWCQDENTDNTPRKGKNGNAAQTALQQEQDACQQECLVVQQALEECTKRTVHRFFKKGGLTEDGIMKQ